MRSRVDIMPLSGGRPVAGTAEVARAALISAWVDVRMSRPRRALAPPAKAANPPRREEQQQRASNDGDQMSGGCEQHRQQRHGGADGEGGRARERGLHGSGVKDSGNAEFVATVGAQRIVGHILNAKAARSKASTSGEASSSTTTSRRSTPRSHIKT